MGVIGGLSIGTTRVWAQPVDRQQRPGRFKLGPLYLTPSLRIVNAGVDTNVFNSRAGEVADTAIALRLGVSGALPVGRRLRLRGNGHVDVNYFGSVSSQRSADRGGEGQAEFDLGPTTWSVAGGGSQGKQRFSIDVDDRILRLEKWGEVGLRLDPSRRLSWNLRGSGRAFEFEKAIVEGSDVREDLNRNSLTATVETRFALTPLTSLLLSAERIEDRFPIALSGSARKLVSYRYLGGFELERRALVKGRILGGIREFPAVVVGASAPYRTLALMVSASWDLARAGQFTATATRDVRFALRRGRDLPGGTRDTYVSTDLKGELTLALPYDFIARSSVGFEQAKYRLPFVHGQSSLRRVDHRWTYGFSLLRQVSDTLRIGAALLWSRRNSSLPRFTYEGLRYGFQAEVVP